MHDDKLLTPLAEMHKRTSQTLPHKLCHKGSFEYFDCTRIAPCHQIFP
jgi:hypothetical protein